ncbi:MAG TPA: 50S ribosomal protein L23 [Candidatus Solibacter sp.]|jgi:large subunit ribosomal protein L23|nr:50S ribosomal protein L23 [Candidatus Solibacter sp.]
MRSPSEVILKPLISEKSYSAMQFGKYTFDVHPSANKIEIARAVEEAFEVNVVAVNTMTVQGKERRRRNGRGFDPKRKKAVVTLAPGQQIARLFETSSG